MHLTGDSYPKDTDNSYNPEQKETGQKVQTSSYKISTRDVMYKKITIGNTAI